MNKMSRTTKSPKGAVIRKDDLDFFTKKKNFKGDTILEIVATGEEELGQLEERLDDFTQFLNVERIFRGTIRDGKEYIARYKVNGETDLSELFNFEHEDFIDIENSVDAKKL